jgi:hypothetical protein
MTLELPKDAVELLDLAVHHPDGASALWEGQLESTAALYQVHPSRVEALRERLSDDASRAAAEATAETHPPPLPKVKAPSTPPDPRTLLAMAVARPEGLEMLLKAPLETAAICFGAHVFVVEEARRLMIQGFAE